METIEGQIIDIQNRCIFPGRIEFENGKIKHILHQGSAPEQFILPGFIDAHVHIESSLLTPEHFGQLVARCGTVAVVTDPHEIANVLGEEGINFMIHNAVSSPIKTFFSLPSCVPATPFDRAGAVINAADTERLLATDHFVALSEMMNVPGVLFEDPEVMGKINTAHVHHKPIDGHAPLLSGNNLKKYVQAGISTDHEATTLEEAREKAALGMHIIIRNGSAAKNYEALAPLLSEAPEGLMFCTDDAHPDDLQERGHIDAIVRRAVADGYDLFNILSAACIHPVSHYNLPVGLLRIGDPADFIVVDNLKAFHVKNTYVEGICKYRDTNHTSYIKNDAVNVCPNRFSHDPIEKAQLAKPVTTTETVIQLIPNELVTDIYHFTPVKPTHNLQSVPENDILKIVYVNRYENGCPQVAFIRGFGLHHGALASSISHDSHNIIAVGTTDEDLTTAINTLIAHHGGLVAVTSQAEVEVLPLPLAGIMSPLPADELAKKYHHICQTALSMGTTLKAPFMTLAFMSLVVIPNIKIGEKGLFDYNTFNWLSVQNR
jgi:adenine deaminase